MDFLLFGDNNGFGFFIVGLEKECVVFMSFVLDICIRDGLCVNGILMFWLVVVNCLKCWFGKYLVELSLIWCCSFSFSSDCLFLVDVFFLKFFFNCWVFLFRVGDSWVVIFFLLFCFI